jgi:WD40 repeat protein
VARLRISYLIPLTVLAASVGLSAVPASAAVSGTWAATGGMSVARFDDTATLLPDGQVLVAGGASTSAELYNPTTGVFAATGALTAERTYQSATLLPDGQVLVAGGATTAGAELYNPATGSWALTGALNTNREEQSATLLPDGEVLVAGGYNLNGFAPLASAELYNPATGAWTATGSMHTARADQSASLLENGEVLVTGGVAATGSALAGAELYNPATGTWTTTGSMTTAREGQGAAVLKNGDVLVTAGIPGANGLFAELYTPASGQWTAADNGLNACSITDACRDGSSATLLGNGDVLVAGGLSGLNSNPGSSATAIRYNPTTGSWISTGSLNTAREDQTATVLTNGQVLITGGVNFVKHTFTELAGAELYTP